MLWAWPGMCAVYHWIDRPLTIWRCCGSNSNQAISCRCKPGYASPYNNNFNSNPNRSKLQCQNLSFNGSNMMLRMSLLRVEILQLLHLPFLSLTPSSALSKSLWSILFLPPQPLRQSLLRRATPSSIIPSSTHLPRPRAEVGPSERSPIPSWLIRGPSCNLNWTTETPKPWPKPELANGYLMLSKHLSPTRWPLPASLITSPQARTWALREAGVRIF